MNNHIDITGERYGRLVAIRRVINSYPTRWRFQCDCGKRPTILLNNVRAGRTTSCGCIFAAGEYKTTHRRSSSKTYRVWAAIHNKPHIARWDRFENFYTDMGEQPAGRYLCRKNLRKKYSKQNCYWGNERQVFRHKIWVVNGEEFTSLQAAGDKYGKTGSTILNWCCGYQHNDVFYPPKDGCFVIHT